MSVHSVLRESLLFGQHQRFRSGRNGQPPESSQLERSRRANWKHGGYSAAARAERREARSAIRLMRNSSGAVNRLRKGPPFVIGLVILVEALLDGEVEGITGKAVELIIAPLRA